MSPSSETSQATTLEDGANDFAGVVANFRLAAGDAKKSSLFWIICTGRILAQTSIWVLSPSFRFSGVFTILVVVVVVVDLGACGRGGGVAFEILLLVVGAG